MNNFLMSLIKICQLRIEIVCRVKQGKIFWKIFCYLSVKRSNLGLRIWSRASKMNIFLMFLIKICQLRIEIVCQAKRGKFFLKIFLLFECRMVEFGPQNIIWGLKNGSWGGRAPGALPWIHYWLVGVERKMLVSPKSIIEWFQTHYIA